MAERGIEDVKREKDGLDVRAEILQHSLRADFSAIPEDDFKLFRWFGVYQQRPNDGHFMQRVKIPGGQLNPAQLLALAQLAQERGRGFSDITTRQDIQYHWLTLADIKPVWERLAQVGLNTQFACGDTPRNVVGCPLAGVLHDEIIDSSAIVQEVTRFYEQLGKEASNLPRKYKTSIGGCPLHCQQPQINDLSFYGVRRANGQTGYGLLVGGGLRDTPHFAQPLRAFVRPDQVKDVCKAVVMLFRDHGYREHRNRARLKFLVADKGWQWIRDTIEATMGYALEHDESLLQPPAIHSDHMGVGKQKDGLHYVGVPIERGRFSAQEMTTLAQLAGKYSAGPQRIRLSNKQNVLLLDVPPSNVEPLVKALTDAGLPPRSHSLRGSLVSCTGIQFCNLSMVETKARAASILAYLEQHTDLDVPLMISVTGCPNSCAQYQIADIGLTGLALNDRSGKKGEDGKPLKVDHFNVLLGGCLGTDPQFGQVVAKKIPADRVHLAIANLIRHYLKDRVDDAESFPQWCSRNEPEHLQKLIVEPVEAPDAVPLVAAAP